MIYKLDCINQGDDMTVKIPPIKEVYILWLSFILERATAGAPVPLMPEAPAGTPVPLMPDPLVPEPQISKQKLVSSRFWLRSSENITSEISNQIR